MNQLGGTALFAAADAQRDHALIHPLRGESGHLHRVLHAELPDRVQNPSDLYGRLPRRGAHRREDRREILPLPKHHAGGDNDLGIPHVLRRQPLQQAACDQRIIVGGSQTFADCAKGPKKSVEIGVMIESAIFLDGSGGVELVQGFRLHRTFQMEM